MPGVTPNFVLKSTFCFHKYLKDEHGADDDCAQCSAYLYAALHLQHNDTMAVKHSCFQKHVHRNKRSGVLPVIPTANTAVTARQTFG
ncbi:hypothetical protein L596_006616 [Steinernema carpocapsae]|uniref:Uncharacterized protein n=1 Tax=Steinernema carpocapsae TaxID=34508 RepID=A0A4U8V5B4_STECR|nr:hypothetical protein L596_006616 [Steinernema carpocapsae]